MYNHWYYRNRVEKPSYVENPTEFMSVQEGLAK